MQWRPRKGRAMLRPGSMEARVIPCTIAYSGAVFLCTPASLSDGWSVDAQSPRAVTTLLAEGRAVAPIQWSATRPPVTPAQVVYLTPSRSGDDSELLQNAVDSMPAGGVVHLGAGTYHLA